MKKFLLFALLTNYSLMAQDFFTVSADGNLITLTEKGAKHLASLPLHCIETEFPNKTGHTSNTLSDHQLSPKQLHPSFYGCLDWHSSVHGHWLLVKVLKMFPNISDREKIIQQLNRSFDKESILKETDYFKLPLTNSWERAYGWAWLLKLDEELYTSADPQMKQWHQNLQPLTKIIVEKWMAFLPKETYPNRTGVHPNTGFCRSFALDYARTLKNVAFEKALIESSIKIFGNDTNSPTHWEPNGSDFLSPTLEEIDLMRRIYSKKKFNGWLKKFVSPEALRKLFILPHVSDRTDYQIVHLDGLSFSRAWCMRGLATMIDDNKMATELNNSALNHLKSALPNVVSGNYGGDHWLASFALYALTN